MAIQFNPNALDAFRNVNLGNDNAIANLNADQGVSANGELGSVFWKPFRSGGTRSNNNAVRTEFLKSLGNAFNIGGMGERNGQTTFSAEFMNRLEEILGPAFKRSDFGIKDGVVASGKPLTQRRITAVTAAVDAYVGRADNATGRARANVEAARFYFVQANVPVAPEVRNQIDGLIDTAVNAALNDPDALELVVGSITYIIRDGAANMRTPEAVKARVDGILANVAELKAAAKGSREIVAAGLHFLSTMRGKNLPDGAIRTIVDTLKRQDIGAVKSLSPSSSAMSIHKAVAQLMKNYDKAMKDSGAEVAFAGEPDDQGHVRNFCIAVQMTMLGEAKARAIKTLLEQNGAILDSFYADIVGDKFDRDGIDEGLAEYVIRSGRNFGYAIEAFYDELQRRLGTAEAEIKYFNGVRDNNGNLVANPDYGQIDGGDIFERLVEHSRKTAAIERPLFLKEFVPGESRGAGKVRAAFDRAFAPVTPKMDRKFAAEMGSTVRGMLNRNLCVNRKAVHIGNFHDSRFLFDLAAERIDVVLPDGSHLNANEAPCDKLAAFLTNGAKNTLAALDEAELKKLAILVSLLNSPSAEATGAAGPLTLDPGGRDGERLRIEGGYTKRQFKLSFVDNNSALMVSCETERNIESLCVKNAEGEVENVDAGPGSKVSAGFDLKIPVAELDRLAGRDFRAYGDAHVQQAVENPDADKPWQNLGQALGNDFAFGRRVACSAFFKVTVN